MLTTTNLEYKKKPKTTSTTMTLFDINENREYGDFFKGDEVRCYLLDKQCVSEEEWNTLIRPYMND